MSNLDKALIVAALYGTAYSSEMWEHWSPDDIKHFEGEFMHSPNYKEATAAIEALITRRCVEELKEIRKVNGHGATAAHVDKVIVDRIKDLTT